MRYIYICIRICNDRKIFDVCIDWGSKNFTLSLFDSFFLNFNTELFDSDDDGDDCGDDTFCDAAIGG